jgi:hypothetical protein
MRPKEQAASMGEKYVTVIRKYEEKETCWKTRDNIKVDIKDTGWD